MSEATIKSLTQGHFPFEPYTPMGVRGDWVRLRADRVALPTEGAVVDFQDVMTEETAHFFMTPSLILRPIPPTQQQLDGQSDCRCYKRTLSHHHRHAHQGELQSHPPTVINGLFGVKKDEKQDRLIFDGRRANLYFTEPVNVMLPNPSSLLHVWLDHPTASLFICKTNILLQQPSYTQTNT